MIKALFFDLDGTLLNSEKKIPPSAAAAIRYCRNKGIGVFFASARSPRLAETLGWGEEEFSLFDGGIYSNGGYVEAAGESRYAFIDPDVVKKCVSAVNRAGDVHLSLHTPGHGYAFNFPINPELKRGWGVEEDNLRPLNGQTMARTAKMLVFWGNLVGETKQMPDSLCREMQAICDGKAHLYITDRGAAMQVTSLQAGKKAAVEYVRQKLGLRVEEIAVFGDDHNDMEVIEAYPNSVAMGNAVPEIKAAAKYVTCENDRDGIARALSMLGLTTSLFSQKGGQQMLIEMGIKRGVNLGGWLSQCDYSDDRLNNFIKESDIETIASWGLDHVRIPVDYNVLETEEGEYKPEGFARLDKAFSWCEKNGLKVVLDLHKTKGYSFDKGEQQVGFFDDEMLQERFIRLWEEFARHYGSMHDRVVFELLNEVTEERFCSTWNALIAKTIERIRRIAPDTVILVGSYWNNSASSVHALEKPYDDKVVYNMHSYDPLVFTHQGAPWVDGMDVNFRQDFEDSGVSVEYFENFFAQAIAHAKKNNTVLYCGEYGVIDRAKPEDWVKWYKCIHAVFEKHGIARAAWSYKQMDFGISDARMDGVREELVKYL